MLFVTFAKISLDAQSYEDQALGVSIIPLVCVNMMLPPYVTIGISFFTVLVSYLKLILTSIINIIYLHIIVEQKIFIKTLTIWGFLISLQ